MLGSLPNAALLLRETGAPLSESDSRLPAGAAKPWLVQPANDADNPKRQPQAASHGRKTRMQEMIDVILPEGANGVAVDTVKIAAVSAH